MRVFVTLSNLLETFLVNIQMSYKIALLQAADSGELGRVDLASFDDQTLMELLVSNLNGAKSYANRQGDFNDIKFWSGVNLRENGSVRAINWDIQYVHAFHEVFGPIAEGGSIDLQYLPRTIETLSADSMQMVGTVTTHQLPQNLVEIHIQQNKFEGPLDLTSLPESLNSANFSRNSFSGSLDFSSLPPSISVMWLHYNAFSGCIDLQSIPNGLLNLDISENNIRQPILSVRFMPTYFQYDKKKIKSVVNVSEK